MSSMIIENGEPNRAAYSAPKLTVYGNVAMLTASGSGATAENGSPGACAPPNGTKRPC